MGLGAGLGGMFEKFGGSGAESSEPLEETGAAPEGAHVEGGDPQPQPAVEQPAAATTEPIQPAAPAEAGPPGFVPMAAMLDFRERAQRAEQELARYRQQSQAAPSIYDHPDGPEVALAEQMQQAQTNMRFEMSERFAVNAHGADVVKAAQEWAVQQDPYTKQAILSDPDPVGSTVTRYRQSQALAKVGSDPDAYARTWAEQNGYVKAGSPQPAPVPQQGFQPAAQPKPAAPTPPPPSLATVAGAPGTGLDDAPTGSALGGLKFKLDR